MNFGTSFPEFFGTKVCSPLFYEP